MLVGLPALKTLLTHTDSAYKTTEQIMTVTMVNQHTNINQ